MSRSPLYLLLDKAFGTRLRFHMGIFFRASLSYDIDLAPPVDKYDLPGASTNYRMDEADILELECAVRFAATKNRLLHSSFTPLCLCSHRTMHSMLTRYLTARADRKRRNQAKAVELRWRAAAAVRYWPVSTFDSYPGLGLLVALVAICHFALLGRVSLVLHEIDGNIRCWRTQFLVPNSVSMMPWR